MAAGKAATPVIWICSKINGLKGMWYLWYMLAICVISSGVVNHTKYWNNNTKSFGFLRMSRECVT